MFRVTEDSNRSALISFRGIDSESYSDSVFLVNFSTYTIYTFWCLYTVFKIYLKLCHINFKSKIVIFGFVTR